MTVVKRLYKPVAMLPMTELMLLLVAIFWGTSYGVTKSALVYTGVFSFIAIRFGITFLMLLPILARDSAKDRNGDWQRALPTGFILLSIFICEVSGIALTSATNAAILISLSMIFTAFAEVLINRVAVSRSLWMVSVISVLGVILLSSGQGHFSALNWGDGLILVAAVLRALMVTVTKRITAGRQITALSLTAIQSLIVSGGAFTLALASNVPITLPATLDFWAITLYLVLFCTLFAFFAQNFSLRKTSPTRVALLMGSEPLFGALFAVFWLGESLTSVQVCGALLVVGCVMYIAVVPSSHTST